MKYRIYTAEWCSPCKNLKAWIKEKGLEDKVEFIDVDEVVPDWVRGIPVLDAGAEKLVGNENIRPFLEKL